MTDKLKQVDMFTDGSCSCNPGPGGWGTILRCGATEKVMSGGEKSTTNNRMELTAVIEGLKCLKYRCNVTVYTDSQYVVNGIQKGWAAAWRAKGWVKSDKKPALNPDLWGQLLDLIAEHSVAFVWVKGHDGHPENERCDALAVEQTKRFGGAFQ